MSRAGRGWGFFFGLTLLFLPLAGAAATARPLTLDEALALANEPHPDLRLAEAEHAGALAEQALAAARQDFSVSFEGGLRSGRPTAGDGGFTDDNSVRLTARKTLHDFGRTTATLAAAESETVARQAALIDALARRRLDIMARFFDVLVADTQYAVENEFLAVAYVSFDEGRSRLETGQISRVDLAELEARYQEILLRRNAGGKRQRMTRALLADALNRPGQLAAELEEPKLAGNQRALPEYEMLLPAMLAGNPRLLGQQSLLAASQQRLESLRADKLPLLDAELEAADYSRATSTRDSVRAGVILNWPLYQGNRVEARLAREQAQFHKLQAAADKLRMELSQALLETWLEIEQLQRTGREVNKKLVEHRELVVERARGQYEVELRTNLGNSMAEALAANLARRKNEYQLALAFTRLEALLGKPLAQAAAGSAGDNSQKPEDGSR